ncbi:hypothetical protein FBU59_002642 [Linderina macrospora]|uniref:Uncharacterized protein n=1 Tax=Linderina macrospora TaxID=4868 RepID=A0ACC1JAQ4_9FUNG|nr:hypothetical protein FBU59_002642 [Linderina macrospora]
MALNAAMIEAHMRNPVPLPHENFLYHCNGVSFDLKIGDGYPANSLAYTATTGTAFVSNQRIVFLAKPTASKPSAGPTRINSFTAPHSNLRDQKFSQPMFGANRFEATVVPVAGGGVPSNARLTLTFKEGGGYDFATKVREMGERIQQIGEVPAYDEQLPAYDHPPTYRDENAYPEEAPPGYEPVSRT